MEQIGYAIKAVKETEYFVDESVEPGEQCEFTLNAGIHAKSDLEEIHFTISAIYQNKGTSLDFLRGKTTSVFAINNMKDRIKIKDGRETIDLPDPLWITLFSISYTHARAMLSRSSAGTKFGHMILPLVSPEEQFRAIFKKELEKSGAQVAG
ncbi:MAG: hypothetical protein WDN75_08995 [Bacteroidota bacterium]